MGQPSQHIADRYQVELTKRWQQWFDGDAEHIPLAGEFRDAEQHPYLLDRAPSIVWPGLMLPDTLPLIGNAYGDWLCVRVDQENRFGELVHWYHGGGDWIPVGNSVSEAVLHDAVDQFRPRVGQVLRGAAESTSPDHLAEVIERLRDERLHQWLVNAFGGSPRSMLRNVLDALSTRHYVVALKHMESAGWAVEASLCDQIEYALQEPIRSMSNPEIARQLGMNYEPDYVRWVFDARLIPSHVLHQIQEILHTFGHFPVRTDAQDWEAAERLARRVLAKRADLAWAVDIAGWAAQRRGDLSSACKVYFDGRFASAFSNQSIRMRSHGFEPQFGKVALAELWNLRDHLLGSQRDDDYVQIIWQTPARALQSQVQAFWLAAGENAMQAGKFAAAYHYFFRAGWDIGAQRMTDYVDIFGRLIDSAEAAGWHARAAVAAMHLACLAKC